MTRVVVLAPELLGPWAAEFRQYVSEELSAPGLEWLLSRARRADVGASTPTYEDALAFLFGVPAADVHGVDVRGVVAREVAGHGAHGAAFAHAAFAALADGLKPAQGEVLVRLDPVFLNATPHGAEVVAGERLALPMSDAQELVAFLNAQLEAPWRIEIGDSTRWYVRLPTLPALTTTAPAAMVEARFASVLPEGDDGQIWRRWLTEVQMLLHDHPLNALREQAAMHPVNSVWLWGQGSLPVPPATSTVEVTYTDSRTVHGLACWHGAEVFALRERTDAWLDVSEDKTVVLVDDSCLGLARSGDVEGWRRTLETMEERYFAPLARVLREGHSINVELHTPGARAAHLNGRSRLKFWRAEKPLHEWLSDV